MQVISGYWLAIFLSAGWLAFQPTGSRGDEPLASEAIIRIDAAKAGGRVSRYLTGACIEDVNHEIYGGLYSQMIFGESFQEAPVLQPLQGFVAYGGSWALQGEELHAGGGAGPRLISSHAALATGEVGVEVFFSDRAAGNAGLIVKTSKSGLGPDNFDGYEVSLDPSGRLLRLGRHRHNWEPIKDVPCAVPVGEWIPLAVRMTEQSLEILVNGKSIFTFEDRQHPLKSGGFGLRQWQRPARYRRLYVKTGDHLEPIPFQANRDDAGAVSGMWRYCRQGSATARYTLETTRPFIGRQSQRLVFVDGEGAVGVENQGLNRWGLSFVAGKTYEGYVWARADEPVDLFAGLESRDGARVSSQAKLVVADKDWQKLHFTLTSEKDETAGRYVLKLNKPGSVVLGHAFLEPGAWGRFKGLPLRRDVVEAMIDQGLTTLRYGGSMVNTSAYRWQNMIGPRDRRPPYRGTWYEHSTNGWGIIDFLNLCEAAGFLPFPAFSIDETPGDLADFIDYVNGPAAGPRGKKRAADGHPAPYGLKHLELGNEERVDEKYWERFRASAEAIWAVDPEIILIVGDFAYRQPITDPDRIKGSASGITSLAAHRKILELARRHEREIWFDIHIGTEHPGALGELAVVPSFVDALAKISGGARHKVVIFELNAGNHAQRRALANAIAIGTLQQLGDRLPVVCSANGLQPDGQNDNGWDQGLLFLDPSKTWLQPPGHVTRMIARSYQPVNIPVQVEGKGGTLKVAAAGRADGKSLVLRVVNTAAKPVTAQLVISGFAPSRKTASVEELAGPMDAVNSAKQPDRIVPHTRQWRHELQGGSARYTFPGQSITVLRFE